MKNSIKLTLLTLMLLVTLVKCKNEYVYHDIKPQLELNVKNQSGEIVTGALITLYLVKNDWSQKVNIIQTLETDSKGTALFKNLDQRIYYFFVEKGTLNNALEVSYFALPLKLNEIRVIQTIVN
ncbi:MAG: hypothetical protein WCJ95_11605 [Mariniphaga sp.]